MLWLLPLKPFSIFTLAFFTFKERLHGGKQTTGDAFDGIVRNVHFIVDRLFSQTVYLLSEILLRCSYEYCGSIDEWS